MKKIILLSCVTALSVSLFGQSPLKKGRNQINAGICVEDAHSVPFYAGIDHAVHNDVTIGGEMKLRFFKNHYYGDWYYDNHGRKYRNEYSELGVGLGFICNGNYHFNSLLNIPDNFDFYSGANLGIYINHDFPVGAGLQVGGRYYLTNKFGFNIEVGAGNLYSHLKMGISYRL